MNSWLKRAVSVTLSAVLLAPVMMVPASGAVSAAQPSVISELKVNSISNPLGIDTNPIFSWVVNADGYAKSQSAYKLTVSSTAELAEKGDGDVWDSGKTAGENNYDIAYAGNPLASKTEYFWTVEVWDEADKTLGVSDVSRFSTGILNESEWEGDWITYPYFKTDMTVDGANWIWRRNGASFEGTAGGTQYFRKTFTVDGSKTVDSVIIGFSADNQAALYFNGVLQGQTASWNDGVLIVATDYINRVGTNTIAMSCINNEAGYAGAILKAVIKYTDGTSDEVVTDSSWRVGEKEYDGWYSEGYDDSSWQNPDQSVAYGASPWNKGISLQESGSRAAPLLRKEFRISKSVESAFAYVCGLGFFDMKINGQSADDSVMNPGNTQYDRTVPYRTFDVTGLIANGKNAIGVELGNGFYNEIGGVWGWQTAIWRDNAKLLLNLVIKYTDGTEETIKTGTDWKTTKEGPTVSNSTYYGDYYDARREQTGFDKPGFDDSAWKSAAVADKPTGTLKCQTMDPMKKTSAFAPKSITRLESGSYIVRAPEMVTGWAKLNFKAAAGTEIVITYGETLKEDGTVQKVGGGDGINGGWWAFYLQQDKYTAKGEGTETFEPKFSYKGFEYIQIDNYEGELTADDVEIYRINNSVKPVSEFSTSSEMLNRLHSLMHNTILNNFQAKPTDSPVFEKNGWLGDANVALSSMMYNFDMSNYLPNFIEIMEDCWNDYGTVPDMVPTAAWGLGNNAVWNTIFVYGVAELAEHYGSKQYIAEQYDVMREFTVNDINTLKNNGWVWVDGQLSDWENPVGGSDPEAPNDPSSPEGSGICGTAFVYGVLEKMAGFADELGKTVDAAEYRSAMSSIYSAFNKKYYNSESRIYETTTWSPSGTRGKYRQTSNLVPLAFGLVPDEYVDGVVSNLIADIEQKNYHLDTGCVGTKFILPVLCEYGHSDVAYKILTQTTYPSWGHWLSMGSNSAWEGWENTARSRDHYFLATYDEWFYSDLAGLTDISDGYKTFTLSPNMIGDLNYVNMKTDTVRGMLESSWSLNDDGTATMKITVPFGSVAKVYFPTARISDVTMNGVAVSTDIVGVRSTGRDNSAFAELESGSYVFTTKTEQNPIFKDTLTEAVDAAEKFKEENFTPELWEPLAKALDGAKAVLSEEKPTQKKINDAVLLLESVLSAMNGSEARIKLNSLIEKIGNEVADGPQYSGDSYRAFRSAMITAKSVAANFNYDDAALIEAAEKLQKAYDLMIKSGVNLALNKTVTAYTSEENSSWSWGKVNLTDGDRKNSNPGNEYAGYSSKGSASPDSVEWVTVDLGESVQFDNVVLYGSCGSDLICYLLPVDFEIQVSADGSSWETVHSEKGCEVGKYGAVSFKFESLTARYVRLYATKLRSKPSETGTYRIQIAELEVYNSATAGSDRLIGLEISDFVTLNPLFDMGLAEYSTGVGNDVSSVRIKPYADDGAEIKVNGESVASGSFSGDIQLSGGENVITVSVGGNDTLIKITKESAAVPGDMDGDGNVTVSDVVALRKIIMKGSATEAEKLCGDMDKDGKLSVSDVVALRQLIIKG